MEKKMNKKAVFSVDRTTDLIIGGVILMLVFAALLPEFQTAGDNVAQTGAPLSSLFGSSGILVLVLVAGIFMAIVRAVRHKAGKGR